jgi:molybdopterin-guanine dinucleotide biosynthesis protein A
MLNGVVLMGGNSTRMGSDKSQLILNDQTLSQIAFNKLLSNCDEVFYSINENQKALNLQNTILDQYENEGPLSGIISSLNFLESSIFSLAVDLPKISKESIAYIISKRNKNKLATAFFSSEKNQWESTVSIWEAHALPFLLAYFENGGRSIQKFLFSQDIEKVEVGNAREFANINTINDFKDLY